jgi:hypothetical protein
MAAKAQPRFKRSRWKPGNVYALPLVDGSFGVAQAIVASPGMAGILNVALFDYRYPSLSDCRTTVERNRVIALLATWRAEMNGGYWALVGWFEPCVAEMEFPNLQLGRDAPGHIHHSGGVLENLVSAYHGLLPWNTNSQEDYYDILLAPGVKRPKTARLLNQLELATFRERNQGGHAAI